MARPLRDVFADVAGDDGASAADSADILRSGGHPDLPDVLVAEAVTSYADTAPLEVAEHLAPYVMANSAVPGVGTDLDPSGWLRVLADAPAPAETEAIEADAAGTDPAAAGLDEGPDVGLPDPAPGPGPDATPGDGGGDAVDLDFGRGGAGTGDAALEAPGAPESHEEPAFGASVAGPLDGVAVDLDELAPLHVTGPADGQPVDDDGAADGHMDDGDEDAAGPAPSPTGGG